MAKAAVGISKMSDRIIIDGKFLPEELIRFKAETLVKADIKIKQVSAASIIAKVYRDKILKKLHLKELSMDGIRMQDTGPKIILMPLQA